MDKPYLDAQLKAERVKKALAFPVHISFEQITTKKELDAILDGKEKKSAKHDGGSQKA